MPSHQIKSSLSSIDPSSFNVNAPASSTAHFTEKDCYDALVDIEVWLGRCVAVIAPPAVPKAKARGRSQKTTMPAQIKAAVASGPACGWAGEVVEYGIKRGWIRPVS